MDQEHLHDSTESYLKSLILEVCDSLGSDVDSFTPFGEMGIDSFHVLKIVRRLETDFGALPKSLLFENFRVSDLADYFVSKHTQRVCEKFGPGRGGAADVETRPAPEPAPAAPAKPPTAAELPYAAESPGPIRILEREAWNHPRLGELVRGLYARYKFEGSASRGTRKIAPNLFIGSGRDGYFNYGRSGNIILVYSYAGPPERQAGLREEMLRYCDAQGLQLNILSDEALEPIGGRPFTATPFGAMQRIVNLREFSMEGNSMRRLRYQVAKFTKAGQCRTVEYRGSDPETDKSIAGVIDRWCAGKTMVNPLVHEVRAEILAGTLPPEHRLFLTYLDDVLQNVILISAMSQELNGYLMDLEFYPPDMPLGGLEFTIVRMIEILGAEGSDILSLGGTYGCKLVSSPSADPDLDRYLDDLRERKVFNGESNLQFKNKFRPLTRPIFLCRPEGCGNPDNVIDIIMMIADPEKSQTQDAQSWPAAAEEIAVRTEQEPTPAPDVMRAAGQPLVIAANGRSRVLADCAFNPLFIAAEHVELDLKTDSWAQLKLPVIDAQMRHLHGQLQQPVSIEETLRGVFPFTHFILTTSGQAAEHVFFRAWPRKGAVLQNLLFPSTIFHQIENDFTPRELPHPALFQVDSQERYKGNLDRGALQARLDNDASSVVLACVEVGNNASGGHPVSTEHLRDVKALLARHSIPLVIDATRVLENAQFLVEQEREHAGKSLWTVAREILSYADAVIGSLTKDFCVDRGGIIATRDATLFQRLQELSHEEGAGLDLIERKLIALSLQNRKHIEAKVLRRIEGARLIARTLAERDIPLAHPGGGHCVLIDVGKIAEFATLPEPVASFLAWMYTNTGIRAAAHNVGMQKQTALNDLVRLAVPVGLKRDEIELAVNRLVQALAEKTDIPELVLEGNAPLPFGGVGARFRLERYRNASAATVAATTSRPAVVETPALIPAEAEPPTVHSVPETRDAEPSAHARSRRTQDVAIIGVAGRYPKARNIRELWENLREGRDCVDLIPPERFERRAPHGYDRRYRGGFIDDVDRFDSLFFNISPREAEMLDPQERLFLEVAWEAIEDAGYYPEILTREGAPRDVGVFVGAVWAMYQIVGVDETQAGTKVAPNSFLWSVANRVSYWMNFSGPSLTVDTACSSSLTALYLACEAIQAGECSSAIVGGVNLDLHQAKLEINLIGGALSPDGVCRTFGKGANGYVAGEGIGALLLKPVDQAAADGDHIYGVIKSAAVNHGGRTSGYFVPNPSAQSNVIAAALQKAGVPPRTIGYIEAHGTGTELGDPIEISGLSSAFGSEPVENQTCAIGSIKSNVGHLEAAAGVVSVAKVLLQMQHRQLVPSLHSSELNEHIEFERSPFYVVQKLEEWKAKEIDGVRLPLRAGISSFGAGGANAHVILEGYEPPPRAERPRAEVIIPVSARNEEQLRECAVRLADFLRHNRVDLNDAAYTLQQGRKSFEHRLAIVAGTQEDLVEKLTRFLDGKKGEDLVVGHVKSAEGVTRLLSRKEKQELVRLLSQGRDPRKIAGLWVEGLLADWQGFQSHAGARRVPLPTYPFAGKRHWVGGGPSAARAIVHAAVGMHPMLDSNESTFERQIFKKTFTDRDFFIYDHHVADVPTLPGVAYLEFARKAGEIAAGRPVRKIQNILWVSPIAVEGSVPKEVFIELKPAGSAVQFEVFSEGAGGKKQLHSQGRLLYATAQDQSAAPEYVDLEAIRGRCSKALDGRTAYPLFKAFGLNLGPSFQVLEEVYRSDAEALGALRLPDFRHADLESMVLHPSLIDGSLQSGMAARLSDAVGEMLVPYSIGEVEILHPLQTTCFSYTTEAKDGKKESRVLRSNVLILDETGKVLAKIRESTGVPLVDVHKKPDSEADAEGFSRLYYSYDWEKAPLAADGAAAEMPRSVLLFAAEEDLRERYRALLAGAGAASVPVIMVQPAEAFREVDARSYEIDPRSREDFTRLLDSLAARNDSPDEICFAWPASQPEFRDADLLSRNLERGVTAFLFLCQALTAAKMEGKTQLFYVYTVAPDERQPHNEAASGFVNTLRGEYPKLQCKTVEVRQDGAGAAEIAGVLWKELRCGTQDAAVVRYEAQERHVRKLKSFDLAQTTGDHADAQVLREGGVYLITGGAGGLGLIFADYLAREYKARLILTGRSTLSPKGEARLEELRAAGAEVLYVLADVSSRDDVVRLIGEGRSRFGAIHGVIHSAGVVRDAYIRNKTSDEMRAVFAPKVHGTLHLDELTGDEPLDFFVMFSSLAAVTGNPGQADYSFANFFMDSFAAERERLRAQGARSGRTLSLNWALWAEGGMRPDEQTELALRKGLGMKPLSTRTGVDAFVRGLGSGRSQFAVVEGIAEKLEQSWSGRKKSAPAAPAGSADATAPVPAAQDDGALVAWLKDELSQIVMEFLKLERSDVDPDKILLDLGFDSIGLTTFANAINEKFDLDITPILFFDYPSLNDVSRNLADERKDELMKFFRGTGTSDSAAPATSASAAVKAAEPKAFEIAKGWDPAAVDRVVTLAASGPAQTGGFSPALRFVNHPVAVVGMSGVMPQSSDLEEFWTNLRDSKDLVTLVPPDRWRWEDFYGDPLKEANKTNSKWGAFMKEIDKFDPFFFGISPREAQMMDPQQRIFLEHVWKAIEDSGQKVSTLAGSRTGVFVGVATNDYLEVITAGGAVLDGYSASGNSHSVLANRVSFLLGLRGPSAPLDTACSSSLVAMHRAIESIHTGSCDMAIVGGVHVMLSPAAYISFSSAGMLSGDGKCKTFDKKANGYVRGEGCGAVFLKSLAAAEADGNHIYAVIRATAENHGGRVTALTAPNSVAQAELLIDAYEKGHVDPTTVGYIECHGTGTSLGDPIEIQALIKAFAELYRRNGKPAAERPHIALSSVKTNIGHLETAAGIAGVLKALLAIKHKHIPANIHLEEVNPYINLERTPFYIADKLTQWTVGTEEDGTPHPRRAGVSSFGFGGANAHVVLEEYVRPSRRTAAPAGGPRVIVLSAKNAERLHAYVASLVDYLEKAEIELLDLAFTLQVGRDEMPERLALVVSTIDELKQNLETVLRGGELPAAAYRGHANSGAAADVVGTLVERKELARIAESWVAGARIDWSSLYAGEIPLRISAPTYPFARERLWVERSNGSATGNTDHARAETTAILHPLIHRNTSTFQEQKFSTRFSGEEFFFTDHVVETQKILPGVAYVEMARAAGELAASANVRVVRDLVWERPLIVNGQPKDVEVSLAPLKDEVRFAVRSVAGDDTVTHCTGKLGYEVAEAAPERLDVDAIVQRCPEEVLSSSELYPFLSSIGLNLGRGFQIVQRVYANEHEALALLALPEHLRKTVDAFWLHPALMDGSLHTAMGLMKANGMDVPMSLPYSVGEVQILHPLGDLHYGYATWGVDAQGNADRGKVTFHLLDRSGRILVRLKDFVSKPIRAGAPTTSMRTRVDAQPDRAEEGASGHLQSLLPVWNPARSHAKMRVTLPETTRIAVLGGDATQIEWVRKSYPNAQRVDLAPRSAADAIEAALAGCSFDQLLWIAPDLGSDVGSDDSLIERQEEGVLAVFRIVKALLALGYATKKVQWTIATGTSQRVTASESLRPAHAGIVGLVGSLAKEYPHWDLRPLDLDSLQAVSARECLSLPWSRQGDVLAHRRGEWFSQELALITRLPEAAPAYRRNGVYVVIGGAGGVGEVWTRFMIERYQASVVWIGRQEPNASIEKKINALSDPGPAPLYVSADATDLAALEQARRTVLEIHPAIHGVVHSAIVLRDLSLARMDEAAFRSSLSAKVDVSVNMDRVFGDDALDFMLFFSSIISVVKSPGQANYAAGCTFKDSFAHRLQQRRPYPVKIMNWGYWGNVGIVADESYRKIMQQMGVGSIEPHEGMASLETLVGSDMRQLALMKMLNGNGTAGLNVSEAISYCPGAGHPTPQVPTERAFV